MTAEQSAAYIVAQSALLNAEIEMMVVANKEREKRGHSLAYGEEQFAEVLTRFESILGHNRCMEIFQS